MEGKDLDLSYFDLVLFAACKAHRCSATTKSRPKGLMSLDAEIVDFVYIVAGCEVTIDA